MVSRDELTAMLRRITGSQALAFDDEGVCTMDYDGRLVVLEISAAAESLVLYGALTPLSAVAAGDEAQVLRTLLTLNLSSADLMGAAFALEPEQDAVMLTYRARLDGLGAAELEAAVNAFLALADVWSSRLQRADDLAGLAARFTAEEVEEAAGDVAPSPATAPWADRLALPHGVCFA